MSESIRAAVMTGPGGLEVREFPRPDVTGGGALLRVEMCGICGTDLHTWQGEVRQYGGTAAESETPFPIIPGHEIIGILDEIDESRGPRLDYDGAPLRVGDRVAICPDVVCGACHGCHHRFAYPWCDHLEGYGNSMTCQEPPHLFGGWAEYLYVLPRAFLYRVPEVLPVRVAVMAELMAVSYNLDRTKEFFSLSGDGFATGSTVVVQGAGPMGICHVIKARVMGAGTVIATDRHAFRLERARQFGADRVLDVSRTEAEERVAAVRELTHGRGADLVVECAGVPEAVPEGLEMLRKGGTYVEAGNFADTGEASINPHRHLCARNVHLVGMTNHPFTGYVPSMDLLARHGDRFPFERFVTHEFALERAEEALETAAGGDSLKVVIKP